MQLSEKFLLESMKKRISSLEVQLGQKESYIIELEDIMKNSNQPASCRIANIDYNRFKELQREEYIVELLDKNKVLKDKLLSKENDIQFFEKQLEPYLNKK